jgi:hypothetical protein
MIRCGDQKHSSLDGPATESTTLRDHSLLRRQHWLVHNRTTLGTFGLGGGFTMYESIQATCLSE